MARTLALAVTNPNVDGMVEPLESAIPSAFIKAMIYEICCRKKRHTVISLSPIGESVDDRVYQVVP